MHHLHAEDALLLREVGEAPRAARRDARRLLDDDRLESPQRIANIAPICRVGRCWTKGVHKIQLGVMPAAVDVADLLDRALGDVGAVRHVGAVPKIHAEREVQKLLDDALKKAATDDE